MATSGSDDMTFDARECITFALRKIRVIAANAAPTATQAENAMTELNLMLKSWMKYESLWRYEQESVTPIANTASYTLTTQKPQRVTACRWRNTSSMDLPMTLMSREEYYDLPNKASTGVPTMYYVDYQRDVPVLYIWPVPASVSTETIQLTSIRRFEDVDSLDDDIDIRQEHFELTGLNLAARLSESYGRVGTPAFESIATRAATLLQEALDEDREDEVRFYAGASF